LGLFSASPGSADLVLGSPLFRHVRVWRGVCDGTGTGNGGEGEGEANKDEIIKPHCDYSLPPSTSTTTTTTTTTNAANPSSVDPHATHPYPAVSGDNTDPHHHHPFVFPSTSSYLDIVALGTNPLVSKVVGVTFNGIPVSSDSCATTQGKGILDKGNTFASRWCIEVSK
jgi:hypothetical protein